ELGGDPQTDKMERREKDSLTLRSVVSDYLAQKTGVKEGTLRMLQTYLGGPLYLKPLHGVPLDRISRKDIAARLLAVSKASGAPTAIAFRSALSSLFVWAMRMGLTEHNPVVNSFKPPTPESRDRGQRLRWQNVLRPRPWTRRAWLRGVHHGRPQSRSF